MDTTHTETAYTKEDLARGFIYFDKHGYRAESDEATKEEWEAKSVEERAEIRAEWLVWWMSQGAG